MAVMAHIVETVKAQNETMMLLLKHAPELKKIKLEDVKKKVDDGKEDYPGQFDDENPDFGVETD